MKIGNLGLLREEFSSQDSQVIVLDGNVLSKKSHKPLEPCNLLPKDLEVRILSRPRDGVWDTRFKSHNATRGLCRRLGGGLARLHIRKDLVDRNDADATPLAADTE